MNDTDLARLRNAIAVQLWREGGALRNEYGGLDGKPWLSPRWQNPAERVLRAVLAAWPREGT